MKKYILMILTIILITGCGSKDELKCTNENISNGNIYKTTLNFNFKNNEVSSYQMKMDVLIGDENKKNIEYYYDSFVATFNQYNDKDGVDLAINKNDDGYNVNIKIDTSKYWNTSKLFNRYLDLESTKTYYENLGYICK